jgi:DNA-binding response OmpR family regulator
MKALIVQEGKDDSGGEAQRMTSAFHLGWTGAAVLRACGGREALGLVRKADPDVVLVAADGRAADWMRVIRDIRGATNAVVMAAGRECSDADLIEAVEAGADDYIQVPVSGATLVARVRAACRRAGRSDGCDAVASYRDLRVDPERHEARLRGHRLELTPTEFELLLRMVKSGGFLVKKESLCGPIWGDDSCSTCGPTLRKFVQNLRRKLTEIPGSEERIVTVAGIGYKLASSADSDSRLPPRAA